MQFLFQDTPIIPDEYIRKREEIKEHMDSFNDCWQRGEADKKKILEYLDRMSEFTSRKTI